jgi:hypothetical protein
MNQYNQKYNKDNSFLRYIIVGTLAEMNKKICYYNRLDNDTLERVDVPCLFSTTGQERFLADEFVYDAISNGKAIGNYESVPRCVLNLNGMSVNAAEQTNKFINTKIVREVNGKLRTCYLMTCFLPTTLNFDTVVICSNHLELLKLSEAIVSRIYKNENLFNIDFGGIGNVEAQLSVPADYQHDRPIEFSVNDKKEFKISFSIEVKSFIPCFEHGLSIDEIDDMLKGLDPNADGLVEFRPNKYGKMEMRIGGVIAGYEINGYYTDRIPEKSITSNTIKPLKGAEDTLLDKRTNIDNNKK